MLVIAAPKVTPNLACPLKENDPGRNQERKKRLYRISNHAQIQVGPNVKWIERAPNNAHG